MGTGATHSLRVFVDRVGILVVGDGNRFLSMSSSMFEVRGGLVWFLAG